MRDQKIFLSGFFGTTIADNKARDFFPGLPTKLIRSKHTFSVEKIEMYPIGVEKIKTRVEKFKA